LDIWPDEIHITQSLNTILVMTQQSQQQGKRQGNDAHAVPWFPRLALGFLERLIFLNVSQYI